MAEIKLRKRWDHRERTFDIVDAVDYECDGHDYGRGSVETIEVAAQKTVDLLGRLVAKLHDKNLLLDKDVLDVLGSGWEFI